MTRLKKAIDLHDFYRFILIFGPGVGDIFFHEDGRQLDFLHCLTDELQAKGYQRILHISPTKPIHHLDHHSEELSKNHLWKNRNEVLSTGIIPDIRIGPLGIAQTPEIKQSDSQAVDGLGDVNGLRIIDVMMKEDTTYRTGLVIYNAEVFLQNFSNKRILGGLLSEWLQLPLQNQNTIFFVFTNSDRIDLTETIKSLPVPELKAFLERQTGTRSSKLFIPGPNQAELERLINYIKENHHVTFDFQKQGLFLKWIEAENVMLRTWFDRFISNKKISMEVIRANHWLSANLTDPRSFEEKLEELVGLDELKERILEIRDWMNYQKNNMNLNQEINLHMVFFGNPGTGKTTLARLMGEMFHEYGVLNRGHLVESKGSDLIADVVGGTAVRTNQVIDRALNGVLFIDEAYSLSAKERGGFGQEAIETLLVRMENDRSRIVVILAGYPDKMREFLTSNPGLARRFPKENRFEFRDFTEDELESIFYLELERRSLGYTDDLSILIPQVMRRIKTRIEGFGNAGDIRNLVDSLERRSKARCFQENVNVAVIIPADLPVEYQDEKILISPEDVLIEFQSFVGLEKIKSYMVSLVRVIHLEKIRLIHSKNKPNQSLLENFIFLGNPGTGKTSVARMVGKIYKSLGLLSRGHLVEVSAGNLIAGYVGQTQEKTKEVLLSALDGVLFIDEAYALTRNQALGSVSYGQEALDVIVKYMEDFRDRLVVIAAGYPDEMFTFINSNPGLRSRFGTILEFDDFSPDQLKMIFRDLVLAEGFTTDEETIEAVGTLLESLRIQNPKSFGNAREVRRLFAYMKRASANRIFQENPGLDPNNIPINEINTLMTVDVEGFEQAEQSLNPLPYLLPQQLLPIRKKGY